MGGWMDLGMPSGSELEDTAARKSCDDFETDASADDVFVIGRLLPPTDRGLPVRLYGDPSKMIVKLHSARVDAETMYVCCTLAGKDVHHASEMDSLGDVRQAIA